MVRNALEGEPIRYGAGAIMVLVKYSISRVVVSDSGSIGKRSCTATVSGLSTRLSSIGVTTMSAEAEPAGIST